jgi:hypothetical protein
MDLLQSLSSLERGIRSISPHVVLVVRAGLKRRGWALSVLLGWRGEAADMLYR